MIKDNTFINEHVTHTMKLRFLVRDGKSILQQLCKIDRRTATGHREELLRFAEWRDVPVGLETDEIPYVSFP